MELSIQTPALLFPAISLLMLSYTNRFLAISALIRKLSADFESTEHLGLLPQIKNLRRRVYLIRWAQFFAIISMLGCTLTMFLVYERLQSPAQKQCVGPVAECNLETVVRSDRQKIREFKWFFHGK